LSSVTKQIYITQDCTCYAMLTKFYSITAITYKEAS